MSARTLNKEFFDDLWHTILDENGCKIHSKDTKFFEPIKKLDNLWAHKLLAAKGYKDYPEPLELETRCPPKVKTSVKKPVESTADRKSIEKRQEERRSVCKKRSDKKQQHVVKWEYEAEEFDEEAQSVSEDDTHSEGKECGILRKPQIDTLTTQCNRLRLEQECRRKLAYDYANRKFPWYMKQPIYDTGFDVTPEMLAEFSNPFEMQIIKNISLFRCKLMVIDVPPEMCVNMMERWLKFCKYVQVVVVVRCETLARRFWLLKGTFHAVLMEENNENSWQEELERSLGTAMRYAKQLSGTRNCGRALVFIFSKEKGSCKWDTFKILKKP